MRLRTLRTAIVGALATAVAVTGQLAVPRPASADIHPLRPFTTQRPHWTACDHQELDRAGARSPSRNS